MTTAMRIGMRTVLTGVATTICVTFALAVTVFVVGPAAHVVYRIEGLAAGLSLATVTGGFALMIGAEGCDVRSRPARLANRFAQAMMWIAAVSVVPLGGLLGSIG